MGFAMRQSLSRFKLFDPSIPEPAPDENANTLVETKTKAPDFVEIFPPELSDKLFSYIPAKDLMTCCQVSIAWRHVINNNRQWMIRCKQYGLVKGALHANDPLKWTNSKSHVDSEIAFNRHESPAYSLTRIASNRIERLCTWGRYFRQCLHLERNWREGRYVVHKLKYGISTELFTTADSSRMVLAIGTNYGCIYIWSVAGLPKFREMIPPVRHRAEVEQIRVIDHILAALYKIGLVRAYRIPEGYPKEKSKKLELILQFRVWGLPSPNTQNVFNLFWQEVHDMQTLTPSDSITGPELSSANETSSDVNGNPESSDPNPAGADEDTEQWIRELFRADPWFETEYLASDMIFLIHENHLVISGYACNCFLLFKFETKELVKKVKMPLCVQICGKALISPNTIYFAAKKLRINQQFESSISLFAFDLQEPFELKEIRLQDLTDDIRMDAKNNPRKIVWIAQDSLIYAADLVTQKSIFMKPNDGYVDNLFVHRDYIVYHQYDGFITTLNWSGEVQYITEAPMGIARGFTCFQDFLVCGGDGLQLNIFDVHSGKKLHKIFHELSRIEHIFVHDTKIVCIGRDEPAMLIGYW